MLNGGAGKALFDVAAKATSKDRSMRYQSIYELIEAWQKAKVR
ncbi:hypothetical protein [Clostridium oryzae]|nr:hypothetical protein [Clostridium oryzae]